MVALKARRGLKKSKSKLKQRAVAYDVVCIGRPVQDTLLTGEIFNPVCAHGVCYEHIPLGSKLKVDDATTAYGGNALNASITFARQDLAVALLAQLGTDSKSQDLVELLENEAVSTELIHQDPEIKIGQSTIIISNTGERSVLAYSGSEIEHQTLLTKLENIETRWLYISSLNSIKLLEGAIKFAELNQIKVAFNPGSSELTDIESIKKLLTSIEVLILNKQEAMLFFGDLDSEALARAGAEYSKVCVVTDGPNGSYAFDGEVDFSEPISEDVHVVDRNGAGDAFASGLVSGLAWGLNLKQSLEFGSKNATSVVQQVGAQAGILKRTK